MKTCKYYEEQCEECEGHRDVACEYQEFDYNPDGKINVVKCLKYKENENEQVQG